MDVDKEAGATPTKKELDGNEVAILVAPPVAGSPTNNHDCAAVKTKLRAMRFHFPQDLAALIPW